MGAYGAGGLDGWCEEKVKIGFMFRRSMRIFEGNVENIGNSSTHSCVKCDTALYKPQIVQKVANFFIVYNSGP